MSVEFPHVRAEDRQHVGYLRMTEDDVIVAPLDGGTSGHVAKSVDPARAVRLPLPTSRLREAG